MIKIFILVVLAAVCGAEWVGTWIVFASNGGKYCVLPTANSLVTIETTKSDSGDTVLQWTKSEATFGQGSNVTLNNITQILPWSANCTYECGGYDPVSADYYIAGTVIDDHNYQLSWALPSDQLETQCTATLIRIY